MERAANSRAPNVQAEERSGSRENGIRIAEFGLHFALRLINT